MSNMKSLQYESPDFEVVRFTDEDVLLNSVVQGGTDPFSGEKGEGPTW